MWEELLPGELCMRAVAVLQQILPSFLCKISSLLTLEFDRVGTVCGANVQPFTDRRGPVPGGRRVESSTDVRELVSHSPVVVLQIMKTFHMFYSFPHRLPSPNLLCYRLHGSTDLNAIWHTATQSECT